MSLQQWFPRQATRVACVPLSRHDCCENFLSATNFPRRRVWNLDSLFDEANIGFSPIPGVRLQVVHVLRLPTPCTLTVDGAP